MFDIQDATITLGAMGCQTEIAKEIIQRHGDYILQVKNHQKSLNAEIQAYYHKCQRESFANCEQASFEEMDKGHGRIEVRKVHQVLLDDWADKCLEWPGAKSIVCVERSRIINDETTSERSWFLSSHQLDASKLARAIRSHWQIENNLHWQLDVTLNEDRYSNHSAAEVMALIKRFCLNLLKTNDDSKRRVNQRIMAAAIDDDYRSKVLLYA